MTRRLHRLCRLTRFTISDGPNRHLSAWRISLPTRFVWADELLPSLPIMLPTLGSHGARPSESHRPLGSDGAAFLCAKGWRQTQPRDQRNVATVCMNEFEPTKLAKGYEHVPSGVIRQRELLLTRASSTRYTACQLYRSLCEVCPFRKKALWTAHPSAEQPILFERGTM